MYPNGQPGSSSKLLCNSVPIRAMSNLGGVGESIGRIRREMCRVRSHQLAMHSDTTIPAEVSLEFNEEDLLLQATNVFPQMSAATPMLGDIKSAATHLTDRTCDSTRKLLDADVVGTVDEEIFDGWDMADKQAIEEAEQFDELNNYQRYC